MRVRALFVRLPVLVLALVAAATFAPAVANAVGDTGDCPGCDIDREPTTFALHTLEVTSGGRFTPRITADGIDSSAGDWTHDYWASCRGDGCTPATTVAMTASYPRGGMTYDWTICDTSAGTCTFSAIAGCAGLTTCNVVLSHDAKVSVMVRDVTAPTINVNDTTVNMASRVYASANDNNFLHRVTLHLGDRQVRFDSTSSPAPSSVSALVSAFGFPTPEHGTTMTLRAVATDWDFNSTEDTATITFDLRNDLVVQTVLKSTQRTRSVSIDFVPEPGSSTTCGVLPFGSDEPWPMSPCSSPYAPTIPRDGAYMFRVANVDRVGNSAEWMGKTILDVTAPTVVVGGGPADATTVTTADATFDVSATDAHSVASLTCAIDASPAIACSGLVTYPGLGDGVHTLVVRAADAVGNVQTQERRWTVDTTAPQTTITGSPAAGATVTDTWADLAITTDASTVTCALDGLLVLCGLRVSNLDPGEHTYVVIATDAFGRSTTASRRWTVLAQAAQAPTPAPAQEAAPPAQGSVPPADTTRPVVRLQAAGTQRRALVARSGVRVRVMLSERSAVQVLVRVSAADARRLGLRVRGRTPVVIARTGVTMAGARTLAVRLPRATATRLLRTRGQVRATIVVTARDGAGNAARTSSRLVVLR